MKKLESRQKPSKQNNTKKEILERLFSSMKLSSLILLATGSLAIFILAQIVKRTQANRK